MVQHTNKAELNLNNLLLSLKPLNLLCNYSGFNVNTKLGFLRRAIMKNSKLLVFEMFRGITLCAQLGKGFTDLRNWIREFFCIYMEE